MIKEAQISDTHRISESVSRLEIANTSPGFLTDSLQVIDTKTTRFRFEEEMGHDYLVDSILINLLYFAILSVRESEPVLI